MLSDLERKLAAHLLAIETIVEGTAGADLSVTEYHQLLAICSEAGEAVKAAAAERKRSVH